MGDTRPHLEFVDGSRPPVQLHAPETIIGRGPGGVHYVLDMAGVAPQHARITVDPSGAAFVEDLQTRTGTLCNDQHVEGRARLIDGDRIEIGVSTLVFRAGARAAATAPTPSKASAEQSTMISAEMPQAVKDLLAARAAGAPAAARPAPAAPRPTPLPMTAIPAAARPTPGPMPIARRPTPAPMPVAARGGDGDAGGARPAPSAVVVGTPDPEPVDNRTMQMQAPDFAKLMGGLPATPRATRLGMPVMAPPHVGATGRSVTLDEPPATSPPPPGDPYARTPSPYATPAAVPAYGQPQATQAAPRGGASTAGGAGGEGPPGAWAAGTATGGGSASMAGAGAVGGAGSSGGAASMAGVGAAGGAAAVLESLMARSAAPAPAPVVAPTPAAEPPPAWSAGAPTPVQPAGGGWGAPAQPPAAMAPAAGQATAILDAPQGYDAAARPAHGVVAPGGAPRSTPVSTPAAPPPLHPGAAPWTPPEPGLVASLRRAVTFMTQMLTLARANPTLLKPLVYNVAIATAASLVLIVPLFLVSSGGAYAVVEYGGLVLLYFIDYFCDGITAVLVYEQITTGRADLDSALPRVRRSASGIATFAAGSALLDLAATWARERNDVLSRVLLDILYKIWTTATYVMLPSMVIEGATFKQSLARSRQLMAHDPTGVGAGVVALSILSYAIGVVCFSLAWFIGGLMAHLHPAIGVFFFLALFNAYWAISGWMKIAYSTCFYAWAMECQRHGAPDAALAPAPLRASLQ